MAGKSVSPEKIAEAVTLRAAGYTTTAIAERLGVSIRTLHRVFEHHKTKKGEVTDELVQAAKNDLMRVVISTDRIKEEVARLIADDIAHARLLRGRMADATEHLTAGNLVEAALLMRAAAACSTALKNTSDMLRHSMGTERALEAVEAESLPELVVSEISAPAALRMTQDSPGSLARIDMDGEASAVEVDGAEQVPDVT